MYLIELAESFWVLGVYRDISKGQVSLGTFLSRLKNRLTFFIRRQAKTHWGGCFAIGDWNFVEHAGDRHPTGLSQSPSWKILDCFKDIKKLCSAVDMSGRGLLPKNWSYSKMTHNGLVHSHLDHIYRPSKGWTGGKVLPMATSWSDHRVIMATAYIKRLKVERVSLAPRLPSVEALEKTHKFWPRVLAGWEIMSGCGPVMLERWKSFKDKVLSTGRAEVAAMKTLSKKNWVKALRSEHMAPSKILTAVAQANMLLWARRDPPARTVPCWPTVIPAYEIAPIKRRGFVSSPSSPWQVPMLTGSSHHSTRPDGIKKFSKPNLNKGMAALLDKRAECFAHAAKAKWEKMTRTHSSEWFKQSSNKELDEQGSRASVSVEGLQRPGEELAQASLAEMALVAKDYFYHFHTPEPSPPEHGEAQQVLLEDVEQQGRDRGNPDLEKLTHGLFTIAEVKALCSKMLNTAPGPDGIHYGFWNRLMSILDGLQDGAAPLRTFWSVFLDVTEDITLRGSSREGFKDANISLFYKKGDPTLVSNYRPISSMNTDCKMYSEQKN